MKDLDKFSDFLFYHGNDGKISVQVILGEDSVWTTIHGMSEIFGVDRTGIYKHIKNIYSTEELDENSTCAKIAQVQIEGNRNVNRTTEFYNLDVIIAVGYRVSSYQATQFRKWATKILKEFLVKGFVLDDERLKQGNRLFGKDYFKELLERIRDIRASERMFYEKVKELYTTSVDYDKNAPESANFFAKVQNKLEYAIVGKTSAQIIKSRADATLPNMNLKTWKNVKKDGAIQKSDVTVAKNYLNEEELKNLNMLVNYFLDFAEIQANRNRLMKMKDWSERMDAFLRFNEYDVLDNAGSIRKGVADKFAESEYTKYKVIKDRDYDAAFSKAIEQIKATNSLPDEWQISQNEQKASEFDQQLKGLLKVPPPRDNK